MFNSLHRFCSKDSTEGGLYTCCGLHYLPLRMRILLTNDDGIHALGLEILARVAASFGEVWVVAGLVFKKRGLLPGRALAAWALVTNHPHLLAEHYANRSWVEQSFRDLKSGGWHWDESLIRKPDKRRRSG